MGLFRPDSTEQPSPNIYIDTINHADKRIGHTRLSSASFARLYHRQFLGSPRKLMKRFSLMSSKSSPRRSLSSPVHSPMKRDAVDINGVDMSAMEEMVEEFELVSDSESLNLAERESLDLSFTSPTKTYHPQSPPTFSRTEITYPEVTPAEYPELSSAYEDSEDAEVDDDHHSESDVNIDAVDSHDDAIDDDDRDDGDEDDEEDDVDMGFLSKVLVSSSEEDDGERLMGSDDHVIEFTEHSSLSPPRGKKVRFEQPDGTIISPKRIKRPTEAPTEAVEPAIIESDQPVQSSEQAIGDDSNHDEPATPVNAQVGMVSDDALEQPTEGDSPRSPQLAPSPRKVRRSSSPEKPVKKTRKLIRKPTPSKKAKKERSKTGPASLSSGKASSTASPTKTTTITPSRKRTASVEPQPRSKRVKTDSSPQASRKDEETPRKSSRLQKRS